MLPLLSYFTQVIISWADTRAKDQTEIAMGHQNKRWSVVSVSPNRGHLYDVFVLLFGFPNELLASEFDQIWGLCFKFCYQWRCKFYFSQELANVHEHTEMQVSFGSSNNGAPGEITLLNTGWNKAWWQRKERNMTIIFFPSLKEGQAVKGAKSWIITKTVTTEHYINE